jgi:hypothetical protein
MSSDKGIVWAGAIALIESAQPLSDEERSALSASQINTVLGATVTLQAPDKEARRLVDGLMGPIVSALSHLANGHVTVIATIRPPLPDPEPDWLATAARTLRG